MLRPLAEVRENGKAGGLARALAAGLDVPAGFVLPAGAALDDAELADAVRGLGGVAVVRSSASVEDRQGGQAPGVFLSLRGVTPERAGEAVRNVRASASGETARAYLERRGIDPATVRMDVIVQREVSGVAGTAYTAHGDDVLIESAGGAALVARATRAVRGAIAGVDAGRVAEVALAAERAIGGPADVEWVAGDGHVWVVQARPLPQAPAARDDFRGLFGGGDTWSWDAAHNPEPLSPAQAGLVELVERAGASAVRQRVVRGHLYYTREGGAGPERIIAAAELADAWTHEIQPGFARALERMNGGLDAALAGYVDFYRVYARTLAPSLARAGRVATAPRRATDEEAAALSPAWDVAVPTFAEAGVALTPPVIAALQEEDDLWFARAQLGVRRALLGLGLGEDVFWVPPLETGVDLHSRAEAARKLWQEQRALAPPRRVIAGTPVWEPPPAHGPVLRGRGAGGGCVRGQVARLGRVRPPPGAVLVCPTVIPPMAPLLPGAAALVSRHEGLTGHGAALARELGLPCVVGCVGAENLKDGDRVWVDADQGIVILL